jgi:hypothetical protein
MTRPIYLAIFTNGPQHAPWSKWVPALTTPSITTTTTSTTTTTDAAISHSQPPRPTVEVGKLIHVTGNPATGFFLQFKRNVLMTDFAANYFQY